MLEIVTSESGEPVVRWQGLMLASSREPLKEAERWVSHNEPQVGGCEHIVVLGLGCGYHVFELKRRFPNKRLYVLEASEELVKFCERHFSLQMADIEVIVMDSAQKLASSARMQKALSHSYAVLEHRTSMQTHRGFYRELATLLRGRDRGVFREHLRLQNSRQMLFDEKSLLSGLMNDENSAHLLSIKDLDGWLAADQRWTRGGCLIQALRELVK